jgi:hypothetical protein
MTRELMVERPACRLAWCAHDHHLPRLGSSLGQWGGVAKAKALFRVSQRTGRFFVAEGVDELDGGSDSAKIADGCLD